MIVATGGLGFIGRALRNALGGARVLTVDRIDAPDPAGHLRFDLGATADAAALVEALRPWNPSCIVHLAGVTPWSARPEYGLDLLMAETVAFVCNALGIPRLIFLSGWVVYDPAAPAPFVEETPLAPRVPYGVSKLAVEHFLRRQLTGTRLVNLRAASIYGPGQTSAGLIPNLVSHALQGAPLEVSARMTRRDYVHVDDVVRTLDRLCAIDLPGGTTDLNLGGGRSRSVTEVAQTVQAVFREDHGKDLPITYADEATEGSPLDNCLSIAKAQRLGLLERQVPFDDGIRGYVSWRLREGLL